jgi:uncharacterized membrane protein YbhN (UPF0104 family)
VSVEPDEPRSSASSWKLVLKLLVSAGLLLYLSRRVHFREIGGLLARADALLLGLALALYLAGQALSALKWRRLALAVGFHGSLSRFVSYYFIGMFFNTFGFGTVGGDVVRALYLAGSGRRRALALNTVVADRVSGLLTLLAIALGALLLFHHYELPAAIYWGVVGLSSALLAGWRLLPSLLPMVLTPEARVRRLIERDLAPYWNDARLLASIGALSLAFHFSQIGVLLLLTHALDIGVPWSYCFVFGPLVNIMAAVPVSLNGLGVREGGYVYFLAHVGVSRDSAIAFALAWFGVVMLAGAVGGLVYLLHRQPATAAAVRNGSEKSRAKSML